MLVEKDNKLGDGVSERDPDVAGSNERVHLYLSNNWVTSRMHPSAQFVNVSNHQSEDHTRYQVCYWAKYFNCYEKFLLYIGVVESFF